MPLILGFILANLVEANFHRALAVGFGSYSIFFVRPISLVMIVVTGLFAAWPGLVRLYRRRGGGPVEAIQETEDTAVSKGEFWFAGIVGLILAIFLFTAFRYSPAVRLFPVIVSTIGLGLAGYWFVLAARSKNLLINTTPALRATAPQLTKGVSAVVGLGLLVAYALLVPLVGFIVASAVFFLAVMFLSRHRGRAFGVQQQ